MDTEAENKKSHDESLRVQLQQLNERARKYAGEFWQVPFAYLAIVAVTLSKLATIRTGAKDDLGLLTLGLGVFGIFVFIHMCLVYRGNSRAVSHIKEVEAALGLIITVETSLCALLPLFIIEVLTSLTALTVGVVVTV